MMSLTKPLKSNPRAIATQIIDNLIIDEICEIPNCWPWFINLRLKTDYLQILTQKMLGDERLNIPKVNPNQKMIVDFSSPNIAKEMHVGASKVYDYWRLYC